MAVSTCHILDIPLDRHGHDTGWKRRAVQGGGLRPGGCSDGEFHWESRRVGEQIPGGTITGVLGGAGGLVTVGPGGAWVMAT